MRALSYSLQLAEFDLVGASGDYKRNFAHRGSYQRNHTCHRRQSWFARSRQARSDLARANGSHQVSSCGRSPKALRTLDVTGGAWLVCCAGTSTPPRTLAAPPGEWRGPALPSAAAPLPVGRPRTRTWPHRRKPAPSCPPLCAADPQPLTVTMLRHARMAGLLLLALAAGAAAPARAGTCDTIGSFDLKKTGKSAKECSLDEGVKQATSNCLSRLDRCARGFRAAAARARASRPPVRSGRRRQGFLAGQTHRNQHAHDHTRTCRGRAASRVWTRTSGRCLAPAWAARPAWSRSSATTSPTKVRPSPGVVCITTRLWFVLQGAGRLRSLHAPARRPGHGAFGAKLIALRAL